MGGRDDDGSHGFPRAGAEERSTSPDEDADEAAEDEADDATDEDLGVEAAEGADDMTGDDPKAVADAEGPRGFVGVFLAAPTAGVEGAEPDAVARFALLVVRVVGPERWRPAADVLPESVMVGGEQLQGRGRGKTKQSLPSVMFWGEPEAKEKRGIGLRVRWS